MEFSLFAWLLHMHVRDHLCSPHFSARPRVPKLILSEINMLTWHNQKWIIIVNLSTYIFMIAFNSTYFYLIVCYAHVKIFLLYMRSISFIFIFVIIFTDFIFSWYNITKHLVWTLLGITELEIFSTTESASDFLATILYAIFIVVALVLLVNMMIAVLSHTYERVQVRWRGPFFEHKFRVCLIPRIRKPHAERWMTMKFSD